MPTPRTLTGGCLCGATRYEIDDVSGYQAICHCRMCQRASGGAFIGIRFVPGAHFRLTKGDTHHYASTPTLNRHFCPACGSPVFIERHLTGNIGLFAVSLDDTSSFTPTMHICLESEAPWLAPSASLPRLARKPEGMTPLADYDPVTGRATMPESGETSAPHPTQPLTAATMNDRFGETAPLV
jgi:hypothetical protein